MVFFKGVPSEEIKLKLRDALLDGVMILLDLHDLDPQSFEKEGRPFINFIRLVVSDSSLLNFLW